MKLENYDARNFGWKLEGELGVITLDRPAKKNALTFEAYAELRDVYSALTSAKNVKAVVITGAEGNFCSGGDVMEIIGPLTKMAMPELLAFTRLTGSVVLAMQRCPQPIVAAVEGVCVGAGAILAMAADLRVASSDAKTGFVFSKVGLAGCDMGACAMLPRIIGRGRAAELLFTGRTMSAEEGRQWGFYNHVTEAGKALDAALAIAESLAAGPTFAHAVTKRMLNQEWNMDFEEAIESEAQAQAICMSTQDFERAYQAFRKKVTPEFRGD